MKILVLGSSGMAGHMIADYLERENYDITRLSGKKKATRDTLILDITNKSSFEEFLRNDHFDVIINAIGILVKQSNDQKYLATYVNSYMPHQLEYIFQDTKTKIIHLSTDCIFSGKNPPYYENSIPDGELFYDRTKYLGEISNQKDLTFRMSIIGPDLSPDGIGLFNWFMSQNGQIQGYTKAVWNGVTTLELAKAIKAAIEQDLSGLYHLVSKTSINKHDLLMLFSSVFNKRINIAPFDAVASNKTLINTRIDFNFEVLGYIQMIKEMKEWVYANKQKYNHYFTEL